jgi:hypothetical protein
MLRKSNKAIKVQIFVRFTNKTPFNLYEKIITSTKFIIS